jgi:hypothetical protein
MNLNQTIHRRTHTLDRDIFIIAVYCLVVEHYALVTSQMKIRQAGFKPALTDEEVITMEICGEFFKLHKDKDLFAYFHKHYKDFFPNLSDRTSFVRQAANLWQVKAAIQKRLVITSNQANALVQPIDTLPLPVCTYTRAGRDKCFKFEADYGHCAAKKLSYYGFKLGLRVTLSGMITHYPLLAARPHDVNHTEALVEGFRGLAPADKGFIDPYRPHLLKQRYGVIIVAPPRSNMTDQHGPELLKACKRWRKVVETVGSHLTELFDIARTRAHDLWHYQSRIIRKVLAHTVGVFINIKMKRPPLDLDGLLAV